MCHYTVNLNNLRNAFLSYYLVHTYLHVYVKHKFHDTIPFLTMCYFFFNASHSPQINSEAQKTKLSWATMKYSLVEIIFLNENTVNMDSYCSQSTG